MLFDLAPVHCGLGSLSLPRRAVAAAVPLLLLGLVPAGPALAGEHGREPNLTLLPSWERLAGAAVHAATSPYTWAPALGAAVLQIDNMDHQLADWASEHTPVFGSRRQADRISDGLYEAATPIVCASALAVPTTGTPKERVTGKLKALFANVIAMPLAKSTTGVLKHVTDRTGPNGDARSLPSGHATSIATASIMAQRNLGYLDAPEMAHTASAIALNAYTVVGAWARVEAGQHYPSDVLVGMAVGHFLGAFVHEAFFGPQERGPVIGVDPGRDSIMLRVGWTF